MTVADIMTRKLVVVNLDTKVGELRELFQQHHFHHLLVVEGDLVVGVVSDRDLLKNVSPFVGSTFNERTQDVALLNRRVHQIMSRKPITTSPSTSLEEAARIMLDHDVTCLPIVDEQQHPVGIVSEKDLLRAFSQLPVP
jgi:acetoin utilization protein AcuB